MGNSQLCVAVTGRTMSEIRRNRDAATGADIVEMRLDTVDRPYVAGALEGWAPSSSTSRRRRTSPAI